MRPKRRRRPRDDWVLEIFNFVDVHKVEKVAPRLRPAATPGGTGCQLERITIRITTTHIGGKALQRLAEQQARAEEQRARADRAEAQLRELLAKMKLPES